MLRRSRSDGPGSLRLVLSDLLRKGFGVLIAGGFSTALLSCSAGSGVAPGSSLPQVMVTSREGAEIRLSDITRGRPTVLNLWASWCDPCIAELPALARLRDALERDGIQVVGIGIQDDPAELERVFRQAGASFPLYFDKNGQVSTRLKVAGVPETFLIDSQGKFLLFDDPGQGPTVRLMGPRDWDDPAFIRRVRMALAPRPERSSP